MSLYIHILQRYTLQPMYLSTYEYLALKSNGLQILGCVNLVCSCLIGIFRRAFELPDAKENKRTAYVYWTVHHCNSWRIKDQLDITCYFISLLNMFRILISPSSGAWDCAVELLHRSCCRLKQASACNRDTTQTQPHQISNTQRTENKTTDVVIQQHSRKLLMMDILMSETC